MTTFSLMLHLMQEGKKLFSMYNTKLRQMRIDSSPVAVQYHLLPSLSSEFHSWRFDLFLPSSAGRETPASFNIARRRVVVGRSRERRSAIIDPFPSLRRDGATGRERERGERGRERSHKSAIKRPIFGRPDLRGDRRKQGRRERAGRGV